jgi:DNA-binding SARP family transcriptional activator/tetratricopeptide (TPR) repeat protein
MEARLEFGLLGPLMVRRDGEVLPIAAGRQRTLLAALLLNAGRAVSAYQLIEALWGSAPPPSARASLQNYVRRLRTTLGDRGHCLISTEPDGYRIGADAGELDVSTFEDLVGAVRVAMRSGLWDQAVAGAQRALSLWRGEPLADVASDELTLREVPRLTELRLEVLEARLDAKLRLGGHADVIPELRRLAGAHPLRERFHTLLMLALYRDGRQAEALAAYRHARRTLVDELGIEPGPGLKDMHQRLLACDTSLAAQGLAGTRQTPATVPRQLPVATRYFTGRSAELKTLTELLGSDGAGGSSAVIVAIAGTAGVGKTALAVHWAHEVAGRFPDGQLYVNLRGSDPAGRPVQVDEAIRGFLDSFGLPPERIPSNLEAQLGLFRSLVADRRMLIVLDNAIDADQVRPLLAGSQGCLTVVTSRSQLTSLAVLEGADLLTLDLFPQAEARALLARRLGAGRLASEPDATARIIAFCAGLPLALSIVAARATARPAIPLARLAAELGDPRRRLDILETNDQAASIRGIFSWSYLNLSGEAARMFRLLGLHPGLDVPVQAAASLTAVPPPDARRTLDELTGTHLVIEHQNDRFMFHDLLRAYAAEQAHSHESEAERHRAVGLLLDYYTHAGRAAAFLLNPGRDEPCPPARPEPGTASPDLVDYEGAATWFEVEERTLLAAVTQAANAGFDANAWRIAWSLADYLDRRGHLSEWASAQRVAVAAATRLGDLTVQAYSCRGLGRACTELGEYEDARSSLRRALDLYRQLGNRSGEAYSRLALARVCEYLDQYREALAEARQALALFRKSDNCVGLAKALNATGWYEAHMSDYGRALGRCTQALDLYRRVGDRRGEATTCDSLGFVHHHLGDHSRAVASYQEALEIFAEIGDRFNCADTLIRMGDAYHFAANSAAESQAAREAWKQALAILEELGHPSADRVRVKLLALAK